MTCHWNYSIHRTTEHFQWWGPTASLGNLFHHHHCKKCLPNAQYKSCLIQFETIAPCPICTWQSALSMLLRSSCYISKGHNKVSLLSKQNNPNSLSLCPQQSCSSPQCIFVPLVLPHFNESTPFLHWGPQNWMQHCRWCLRAKQEFVGSWERWVRYQISSLKKPDVTKHR